MDPDRPAPAPAVPPFLDGDPAGMDPAPARRRAIAWSAAVLGLGLLAAGILFAVDPARHAIYPACMLYATTGLECPGCGGLRATHHLLHGDFATAWRFNPLAVLLLPFYLWAGLNAGLTLARGRGLPSVAPRRTLVWLGLAAIVLFGILRNLPW